MHATWRWSLASLLKQSCNDVSVTEHEVPWPVQPYIDTAINLPTPDFACSVHAAGYRSCSWKPFGRNQHYFVMLSKYLLSTALMQTIAQTQQATYGYLFVKACLSGETSCKIRKGHINILMQVTVMGSTLNLLSGHCGTVQPLFFVVGQVVST